MRTPRLCIRVATANRGHHMSVMSVDLSVNKHNKNSRPSCATRVFFSSLSSSDNPGLMGGRPFLLFLFTDFFGRFSLLLLLYSSSITYLSKTSSDGTILDMEHAAASRGGERAVKSSLCCREQDEILPFFQRSVAFICYPSYNT